jgi:DNA-binding GntR family transcriptional regulator
MTDNKSENFQANEQKPVPEGRIRRLNRPSRPNHFAPAQAAWRLVYQYLRDEIVSMRLRPGDAIVEKHIAQQHGLSRTPVREATQRLADERLIEIFPQSGTFVARIPIRELPEAMVARKALELTTTRLAAENATKSQVLTLASIIEQQREAAASGDIGLFHRADEAFHAKIADIAGYPSLWQLVLQVKTQVDRFRQLTLSIPDRMLIVTDDHERILDGIAAKDPDRASDSMGRHLDAVLPELEAGEIRRRYGEHNFC